MAEREGRLESQILLHHVQVRVAYAGATDFDQNLAWTGGRLSDVLYLSRATDAHKSDSPHALLLPLVP